MKELKTFYVAYPKDIYLRNYLNVLKILANNKQRTEAHITIRGPYKRRLSKKYIKEYSNIISDVELNISKVDNFFQYNQNTVFYRCDDNEFLRKVWKKFSYNDFNPHITIYDGTDFEWAEKIYYALKEDFKPFKYIIGKLSYLEPKIENGLPFEYLKTKFNNDFFNEHFDKNEFELMNLLCNDNEKLEYIKTIASYIYSNDDKNDISNRFGLFSEQVDINRVSNLG